MSDNSDRRDAAQFADEEAETREDAPREPTESAGGERSAGNGPDERAAGEGDDERDSATREAREDASAGGGGDRGGAGELETTRERYLRLAAEYDNFRKRTERERAETWSRAQAQLVERLIDPLDDLQRVAEHSNDSATAESLVEGFQIFERKLTRTLESLGLETLEPSGDDFDPAVHEAVMTTPAEAPEQDDTVAQVFQRGYQFKGILLRPARVQVRKYEG